VSSPRWPPCCETRPSFGDDACGNADADDPAIWVHPEDAGPALVLNLARYNNVDLIDGLGLREPHSAFTSVARLRLYGTADGRVGYEVVEVFDLPEVFALSGGGSWNACHDDDGELSQVEGMVVDDAAGILYLAQEQVGWWATSVSAPADVEGLTIYKSGKQIRWRSPTACTS
jgi:myo-inositol-hexaphosphate 3-phosphohydrolase